MTDKYAKGCQIEPILPQSVSSTTELFVRSAINQMSILCIAYITEQLSKSYTEKYNVVMGGRDLDDLRHLAMRKYLEYMDAEKVAVKSHYSVENLNDTATETVG